MARELVIDYYFWVLSDWTYFGGPRLYALAQKYDVAVNHMPVKLPTIYSRTGGILLEKRSKQRRGYRITELKRWQRRLGMPINIAPRFFPADIDLASCFLIAAKLHGYAINDVCNSFMKSIWVDELNIASHETVLMLGKQYFKNADELLVAAETPAVHAEYDRYTNEAIERGVFGSPSYLFNGEVFWGQDRLDFLEEAVAKARML